MTVIKITAVRVASGRAKSMMRDGLAVATPDKRERSKEEEEVTDDCSKL